MLNQVKPNLSPRHPRPTRGGHRRSTKAAASTGSALAGLSGTDGDLTVRLSGGVERPGSSTQVVSQMQRSTYDYGDGRHTFSILNASNRTVFDKPYFEVPSKIDEIIVTEFGVRQAARLIV